MALRALRERLQREHFFQVGVVPVLCVVLAATLAPWLAPFDPLTGDLRNGYPRPGGRFLLGTTPSVGLISQAVSVTLGVPLGLVAGYQGQSVDKVVMRLADMTLAFAAFQVRGER
jgi:peptide/nickel transport system permease protein